MTHPITTLQGKLLAAWAADTALVAAIGPDGVFDTPPAAKKPPYVVVWRHDAVPRDGDLAPGLEHRVVLHAWASSGSRKAVLLIVERLLAVALNADLSSPSLRVTHVRHERTDTAVDGETGLARAAVVIRVFSEPA